MKSLKYLILLIFICSCQTNPRDESHELGFGLGSLNKKNYEFKGLNRTYYVYKPASKAKFNGMRPQALVVMLHGCLQSAQEFMLSTGMNNLADKENFLVLYPEQSRISLKNPKEPNFNPKDGHPASCWNWYEKSNQLRDSGESGLLAHLIKDISEQNKIDSENIFVAGISAGAGMASILGSCYPNRISALSLHSGPLFGSAKNINEASRVLSHPQNIDPYQTAIQAYECAKPELTQSKKPLSVQIWHGTKDRVVNVSHAFLQARHFRHFNDFFSGNQLSQSAEPFSTEAINGESILVYSWQKYIFRDSPIEIMLVSHLGHAWSGGSNKRWSYFGDPKGPNASMETWKFFIGTKNTR